MLHFILFAFYVNQRPSIFIPKKKQAWVKGTPIVGDKKYDHTEQRLMDRGMFLCSNQIKLEHPYFNTIDGKREYFQSEKQDNITCSENGKSSCSLFYDKKYDKVFVQASIPLPDKFSKLVESSI